ncbi:MAG: hypothetical protein IH809_05485, partial [Proteobacteria bacterium]|nr:hypothetical protein [Pseudomonadota bacterium]
MIEPGDQPRDETENHCYLPDLCTQHNVLLVVLMAQTVAMVYTLARYGGSGGFWLELANTSLFLMWAALAGAASLCFVRPFLARASLSTVTLVSFVIIMAIMLVITEMAWAVSRYAADLDLMGQVLPNEHGELLVRNLGIGAIVAAPIYWLLVPQRARKDYLAAMSVIALGALDPWSGDLALAAHPPDRVAPAGITLVPFGLAHPWFEA